MSRDTKYPAGIEDLTEMLSIVIPAYNEALRIGRTLKELADIVSSLGVSIEVVVVDDGSTDSTIEVASRHLELFGASRLLVENPNRGKGYAVRTGMLVATGTTRLFMDADGSTDLREIARFVAHLQEMDHAADVVIASIGVDDAIVAPQQWYRQLLGRLGNRLIRLVILPGIRDTSVGSSSSPQRQPRTSFYDADSTVGSSTWRSSRSRVDSGIRS